MTSTESARASQQNETSDALTETRSCDISISDVITEAPPSYEASLHQSGSNARLYSSQSQLVENVGNVATISNGQMGPMESPPMYPGPPVSAAGGYPKDVYPLPPYQTVYSSYSSYGYPVNTNANVVANGGDAAQARAMVDAIMIERTLENEPPHRERNGKGCLFVTCKIMTFIVLSIFLTILFRSLLH